MTPPTRSRGTRRTRSGPPPRFRSSTTHWRVTQVCVTLTCVTDVNPFQFGALALDESFTDREAEIAELRADVRSGQDVVVFAPRRYGKSSLVWRAAQELARDRVLIASVDLMTAPTPAKLAEKLARAIHDDIASPLLRARERLRIFGDLKVTPTITVDAESGAPSFSCSTSSRRSSRSTRSCRG